MAQLNRGVVAALLVEKADSGEVFGELPQTRSGLIVFGRIAWFDQYRFAAHFHEAVGAVVLPALNSGVGGCSDLRPRADLCGLPNNGIYGAGDSSPHNAQKRFYVAMGQI